MIGFCTFSKFFHEFFCSYSFKIFVRFIREALNLSRSVLGFKYVVHELIPEEHQYSHLRIGDPDWTAWNPEHKAEGRCSYW